MYIKDSTYVGDDKKGKKKKLFGLQLKKPESSSKIQCTIDFYCVISVFLFSSILCTILKD